MSIVALRCRTHNREQRLPFHLVQIAFDRDGRRAKCDLTERNGDVIKGPWEHTPRPSTEGLYCQHCLQDGVRTPLAHIDPADLPDYGLADTPVVFQAAQRFDAHALVERMRTTFGTRIAAAHELPEQPPVYAEVTALRRLHPALRNTVAEHILPDGGKLYAFQAAAIEAALDGHDVVVTTPTASGKSLTYTLPVLHTLLSDPGATALYLSPLVALTEDQLQAVTRFDGSKTDWAARGERFSIHRVCRTLQIGSERLTVARYDGQVSEGDRQSIRSQRPRYVLTTPDMLHAAMLGGAFNERQWHYLFRGLRYVVIDELHTYRGIMGAGFANLLRRLQRLCRMHGTNPHFLCASATVVDPAGTVEKLTGRQPHIIDGAAHGGAPQHRRQFVLWNSQASGDKLSTEAKNLLLYLLGQRVRTIAFARSISEINDIYRFVQAELRQNGSTEVPVQPFMRELLPETKRKIIGDLKQGRLHGIIATTALSMGIDIGSLSAAAIVGFPGSIAQLWQQAGRAGRSGEGLIVLIADTNPLDQFFVQHPDVLFDLSAEPVFCNPDNPYIVRGHLIKAAYEAPLTQHDITYFGPAAVATAQSLMHEGMLAVDSEQRFVLTEQGQVHARQPLRNISFSIDVTDEERNPVVQIDVARAQRALHLFAHYQHIDRYYRVTRCDIDAVQQRGQVLVQEIERPEYTTTAHVERDVSVVEEQQQQQHGQGTAHYGMVHCETAVTGYYEVPLFVRNEAFRFQPLGRAAPPRLAYRTQALWLTFNPSLLHDEPIEEQAAGLYSYAGALQLAVAVEQLCDPSDVDGIGVVHHPDTGWPTVLVYDAVPGGVGITEAAYHALERVLRRAYQILAECPYCSQHPESRGCPQCVTAQYGDESTINRRVGVGIAQAILQGEA